jgi:cell wall-associated NlpC family hydrolase
MEPAWHLVCYMNLLRVLTGIALGLSLTACALLQPSREPGHARPATPEHLVVHPPPRGAAVAPESEAITTAEVIAPGTPRLIWVPEWRVYLREGYDAVSYDDFYYLYARGGWYVGETDRGPWRAVGQRRAPASSDVVPASLKATDADRIVDLATRHVGRPYAWAGASPNGFDCSGFVMYVYAGLGVLLPHNAAQQYTVGTRVRREDLRPGDLVFFDRLRHNGIYIGDGQFVHASKRGSGVKISHLDDDWYRERWTGARRVLPHGGP